jgi:hypothetical protein
VQTDNAAYGATIGTTDRTAFDAAYRSTVQSANITTIWTAIRGTEQPAQSPANFASVFSSIQSTVLSPIHAAFVPSHFCAYFATFRYSHVSTDDKTHVSTIFDANGSAKRAAIVSAIRSSDPTAYQSTIAFSVDTAINAAHGPTDIISFEATFGASKFQTI